ncbi:MAG: hypothetical protein HFG37_06630 [Eubacterium sp.]|nr:hypothetical protein [Eubacterium sp.]
MKKVLLISKPYIRCYNHHAFPAAILGCCQDDNWWAYNNFFQIEFNPNYRRKIDYVFSFFYEDEKAFTKGYYMIPEGDKDETNIIPIIKDLINSNSYIVGIWDEYYLSAKKSFQRSHYEHNYIIYGYDDIERVFFSAGYIGDNITWSNFTVKYDEFVESLVVDNGFIRFNNFIPSRSFKPEINYIKIMNGINMYLRSENAVKESESLYGIKGVQGFWEFIKNDICENAQTIHLPSVFALLEHKKLMLERFVYLEHNNFVKLSSEWKEALDTNVNNYMKILNLCIKYNLTLNRDLGIKIYELGISSLNDEICVLRKIINKCENDII